MQPRDDAMDGTAGAAMLNPFSTFGTPDLPPAKADPIEGDWLLPFLVLIVGLWFIAHLVRKLTMP